jgi:hypothetical protein
MTGLNWTEQELADFQRRHPRSNSKPNHSAATGNMVRSSGLSHTPGKRNETEQRYAQDFLIDHGLKEGESWLFESLKLKLGDPLGLCGVWYIPDFWIFADAKGIRLPIQEIVEVKGGFMREKGKLKFQWARQKYPMYRWMMAQWANGAWREIR